MTEPTLKGIVSSMDLGRGAVLVRFDSQDPNAETESLQRFFDSLQNRPIVQILVDMHGVDEPSGMMTALLIAQTVHMRRRGGDLKVFNLSDAARQYFSYFTPLTFLSIGVDDGLMGHLGEDTSMPAFEQGLPNRIRMEASVDALGEATDFVLERAVRVGFDKIELSKIKIAVYEACMNIIEHGYEFDPGHFIDVEVSKSDTALTVVLGDRGKAFDFYRQSDYDVESAFNEKREGGFGLYIIRRSVDEIHYDSQLETGNRLTMIKNFRAISSVG